MENKKRPNEVSTWAVGIGNIPFRLEKIKQLSEIFKTLDGFIGAKPFYPMGCMLCLFKTENDAKGARNIMRAKGIKVGDNMAKVYIDKAYLE